MVRLKTKHCSTILAEKQQNYRHQSSGKIDKYEHVTGGEILPSNQSQMVE